MRYASIEFIRQNANDSSAYGFFCFTLNSKRCVKMKQKTDNFAEFHMLFTEYLARMDSKHADVDYSLEAPEALLDTPYGLFKYISTCTNFQLKLLEMQLDRIDLPIDPEIYKRLISLSNELSKLWNSSIDSQCL